MRFTIERIRTLVLVAGALLLVALGVFLVRAKWKNHLNRHDLPQKLAKDISRRPNGYTLCSCVWSALAIPDSCVEEKCELKNDFVELHDVQIDLYGEDGNADRPDCRRRVRVRPEDGQGNGAGTGGDAADAAVGEHRSGGGDAARRKAEARLPRLTRRPARRQIDVKTSGVTFDRNSGLVTTAQRVDFSMAQGAAARWARATTRRAAT